MSTRLDESVPATMSARFPERRFVVYITLALIVAVVCSYALIVRADFIDYDDNSHVFDNWLVKNGLSWRGAGEAFTNFHASLWVPLTWISFMADISLFGLNPGAMHAVNLAWHVASTVLLFLTLRRMTSSLWGSAFVAALFGLHPLNVESVAWVAERKNVLSTFFWFATLAAYTRYTEKPRLLPYLAALGAAALAMLSKPMAVTIPCTLLLVDFWPLNRFRQIPWWRLATEKVPFFLLTAGTCWMAMLASRQHTVITTETLPMAARVSNALISYVTYLGQIFWPVRLGVFYPHPIDPQPFFASAAAGLLLALSALAVWQWKRRPYLLIGWLWFLGVLVPVLGLVQVGSQARADRFTYVPQLGIFFALTWLVKERWAAQASRLWLVAGTVLLAAALGTAHQVGYWMDGSTLFEHTLAVTRENSCASANAGLARARAGDPQRAIQHFQNSLRILADQPIIWREFGAALIEIGRSKEATAAFRSALDYDPADFGARYKLAVTLEQTGAADEAIAEFKYILRDLPTSAGSHFHLGLIFEKKGLLAEARKHLEEAAELAPSDAEIAKALDRLRHTPAA